MNTNTQALRKALKTASDFIEDVHAGEWSGGGTRRQQVLRKIEDALSNPPAPEQASGELLACSIEARPLSYPLSDYHRALSEGPLNYTWQDKPHRLLYDLIAAVKYYATPAAEPAVEALPLPLDVEFAASYLDGVMEGEHEEIRSKWAKIRRHLSASPAAPEAAKPADWKEPHPPSRHCMCPDCIPSFDDRFVAAKPGQQAQAGEPEVVVRINENLGMDPTVAGVFKLQPLDELITLQSHREAMSTATRAAMAAGRRMEKAAAEEAIAKKDAALKACVELMQYMRSVASFERNDEIDAAITQAEGARK